MSQNFIVCEINWKKKYGELWDNICVKLNKKKRMWMSKIFTFEFQKLTHKSTTHSLTLAISVGVKKNDNFYIFLIIWIYETVFYFVSFFHTYLAGPYTIYVYMAREYKVQDDENVYISTYT